MKKVFFYFLILLAAVWLGVVMYADSGYVLFLYKNTSIETSLWFAILVLVILFLLFYILLRFSSGVGKVGSYISRWFGSRKKKQAHKQTILGLYDLIEGDWARAEKKLLRSAKHSDMPLVNYLASAFMAQNQHAFKRRDSYLRLAQKIAKDRPMAVGLAQASLQIGNNQWGEAAATLQNLHKLQPKNIYVLQLLRQAYLELKDWYSLEKLLPVLRRRKVLPVEIINQIELKVYQELLVAEAKNKNVTAVWKKLPHYLQRNPLLVVIYVKHLLANAKAEEAEDILKMILRKNLDPHLLALYSQLPSDDTIKLLLRAEKWLKDNPEDAALLLCLGRLCRQQKLWGKALHYLQKSAKIQPTLEVYTELAQLMVEHGDLQGALAFYAKGVESID